MRRAPEGRMCLRPKVIATDLLVNPQAAQRKALSQRMSRRLSEVGPLPDLAIPVIAASG